MPFEFINNNDAAIDRAARKRIRSHAAMGKNVGRKIIRPSRKNAQSLGVKVIPALAYKSKAVKPVDESESSRDSVAPEIQRQLSDGMSTLPVPEGSRFLVRKAVCFFSGPRYIPALRNALDPTFNPGWAFVELMFLDEAFLHCAVALSIRAINTLVVEPQDLVQSIRHLSHTFRLVNQRLSKNDKVSDTTIAVVLMLAQYERHDSQPNHGLVHLGGLQRMVELQGGISQLTERIPTIAHKIFRADLDYSLYMGTSTRFSVEDLLCDRKHILHLPNHQKKTNNKSLLESLHHFLRKQLTADLWSLFEDIAAFAQLLNEANCGQSPKLDCRSYHYTIIFFGYHLTKIRYLNSPDLPNRVANTVHLGLIAFLATFLRKLDYSRPDYPFLYQSLRSICQEPCVSFKEEGHIQLWTLFIGASSVFKRPVDDVWLIPTTARTMQALGITSWKELHCTLTVFPWIDAVHNEPTRALWHASSSTYRPDHEI